jgi:hypothetical protein
MAENVQVRLPDQTLEIMRQLFAKHFLPDDQLWLFGSRVDLNKKGGDIDLYVETDMINYTIASNKKLNFLVELKKNIGDQKIDLVLRLKDDDRNLPIYQVARSEGVRIL